MDWTAQVDIYCERLDPSFWAEPLNAITNAAFVVAGLWAVYEARARGIVAWPVWALIGVTFAIGIGSFLFHTFATRWSALADTLPILLFVFGYALAALALIGGATRGRVALFAIGIVVFLVAAGFAVAASGLSLNGSEQYLPAWAAMTVITTLSYLRGHPVRLWFLAATFLFALSLTARSLDMALCPAWHYGTHIFWHLLNGTVIALLLQALIRNTRKATAP